MWEQQTTPVQLTGNLANLPAYGLIVTATVARFPPVRLAFAWTLEENVPLILGQVNFFLLMYVFLVHKELLKYVPKVSIIGIVIVFLSESGFAGF